MSKRIVAYMIAATIIALGVVLLVAADAAESRDTHKFAHFLLLGGRLFMALGLAMSIGLEREAQQKPAGVRTVAMVGVGACLFGLIGASLPGDDSLSRVVQGVITGIGFLGAGTIIKEQFHIEGLTTAATLWAVAGIGVACGLGRYDLAALATAAVFLVLIALRIIDRLFKTA
jgi:putative Mg2+ transporter-C (MgtC) family protein